MVKSLVKIIYHGSRILLYAIQKTIAEEIELSKQAADIRYNINSSEKPKSQAKMSLNEAKLILNVENLHREEIDQKFKHLFEANSKSQSGSFYIQSKIIRAKERLDLELKVAQRIGKITNNTDGIADQKQI